MNAAEKAELKEYYQVYRSRNDVSDLPEFEKLAPKQLEVLRSSEAFAIYKQKQEPYGVLKHRAGNAVKWAKGKFGL